MGCPTDSATVISHPPWYLMNSPPSQARR
uniref:Uncharacterized protein n=1 Tax=Anguilla anguilla TaxID=7936 RepID=A0A0E9TBY1_ANGAN